VEPILVGLSRAVEARRSTGSGELVGARASFWAGSETTEADAYATSD